MGVSDVCGGFHCPPPLPFPDLLKEGIYLQCRVRSTPVESGLREAINEHKSDQKNCSVVCSQSLLATDKTFESFGEHRQK